MYIFIFFKNKMNRIKERVNTYNISNKINKVVIE